MTNVIFPQKWLINSSSIKIIKLNLNIKVFHIIQEMNIELTKRMDMHQSKTFTEKKVKVYNSMGNRTY
jgi:hypothetical protein